MGDSGCVWVSRTRVSNAKWSTNLLWSLAPHDLDTICSLKFGDFFLFLSSTTLSVVIWYERALNAAGWRWSDHGVCNHSLVSSDSLHLKKMEIGLGGKSMGCRICTPSFPTEAYSIRGWRLFSSSTTFPGSTSSGWVRSKMTVSMTVSYVLWRSVITWGRGQGQWL